jgi:hypothetical protein
MPLLALEVGGLVRRARPSLTETLLEGSTYNNGLAGICPSKKHTYVG